MHDDPDTGILDLVDEFLHTWDEFPHMDGVISPMDALILKHGKPAVQQAKHMARRLGLMESEIGVGSC